MDSKIRFEYVQMKSLQFGDEDWGILDHHTSKFAPGLAAADHIDLISGVRVVNDWYWDSLKNWTILSKDKTTRHYSFPDWLFEYVESLWDEAIDRPKDFDKLDPKMQSAVLGTVSRFRDGMSPTAG